MVAQFPVGNELIVVSFELFRGTTKALLQLAPLVFLVRIIVIKTTLGGSREYGTLLKELVYLYIGFFVFQETMEIVMQAPRLAENVIKAPDSSPLLELGKKKWLGFYYIGLGMQEVISIISSVVYWTVCFLYVVIMALMITIGGYIIFFSTLFRMAWMIKAYISLILILSMWPFIWYSVDQAFMFAVKSLMSSGSTMAAIIAALFGGLLKLSVPVLGVLAAMKAPVALGAGVLANAADGAKPLMATMALAKKAGSSTHRKLGVPQAFETLRRPVNSEEIQRKREQKRFQFNDIAPRMAYGAHRLRQSMTSDTRLTENTKSNEYQNIKNYQEFKSTAQKNLSVRKTLNSQTMQQHRNNEEIVNNQNFTQESRNSKVNVNGIKESSKKESFNERHFNNIHREQIIHKNIPKNRPKVSHKKKKIDWTRNEDSSV